MANDNLDDDNTGGKPDDDTGVKPDDKGGKPDDDTGGKPDDEPTGWEAERIELAGDDEKYATHLGRYSTKEEALKAGHAAASKIGEKVSYKGKPGEKATEGEIIDYRKEAGVPEKAEDYDLDLGKGVVLGALDQRAVDGFKQIAHKLNLSSEEVSTITKHQLVLQDQAILELAEHDAECEIDCEAELGRDVVWGKEMKRNLNMVNNLLDTAPEGAKALLMNARLSDGTPFGSSPVMMKFMNTLARQINPLGSIVPNTGQTALDTVAERIKNIEGKMGTDEYLKDEKMQSELRDLYDMREKHQASRKRSQ